MTQEPTILVQEEFIARIDSINDGLNGIKAELEELKGQQEQRFEGVEQHLEAIEGRLGSLEDGMVLLTDLVCKTLEEVRSIGVAMEVYSVGQSLLEDSVSN